MVTLTQNKYYATSKGLKVFLGSLFFKIHNTFIHEVPQVIRYLRRPAPNCLNTHNNFSNIHHISVMKISRHITFLKITLSITLLRFMRWFYCILD